MPAFFLRLLRRDAAPIECFINAMNAKLIMCNQFWFGFCLRDRLGGAKPLESQVQRRYRFAFATRIFAGENAASMEIYCDFMRLKMEETIIDAIFESLVRSALSSFLPKLHLCL